MVLQLHYGYTRLPTREDQQWHMYVWAHALLTYLCLLSVPRLSRARWRWPGYAGIFGAWLGAIESAQAAVCGALQWGRPVEDELCLQQWGAEFYLVVAAVTSAVALSLAWEMWRRRHG